MIHLISSFYQSNNKDDIYIKRNTELLDSLKKNIECKVIIKIHLYVDDENSLNTIKTLENNEKINIIKVNKQPLYSDLFEYAFNNLKNEICMISNSDIYLYEYDIDCLNRLDNNVFSLTRYEYDMSCPLINNYCGSHDSFIFKSSLNINLDNIKHVQNVWGSENSIIDNLCESGYKVFNPCYQLKIVHLHESNLRNEDRIRIPGGKYLIPPCTY